MKIKINDSDGSHLIAVLNLNGDPAVEHIDYILWDGEYHKNGKWSYADGGVALKNGVVLYNQKSTHRNSNNQKMGILVKNNESTPFYIMGRFSETPEKPARNRFFPNDVWEKIINAICAAYPNSAPACREKWQAMEKFL